MSLLLAQLVKDDSREQKWRKIVRQKYIENAIPLFDYLLQRDRPPCMSVRYFFYYFLPPPPLLVYYTMFRVWLQFLLYRKKFFPLLFSDWLVTHLALATKVILIKSVWKLESLIEIHIQNEREFTHKMARTAKAERSSLR